MSRLLRRGLALAVALLCLSSVACAETLPELQLHQPAIGCACCHLLIAGDTVILVDGGTDTDAHRTSTAMLEYVAASGIDHIDAHFVTHYHNDHAQQLDEFSELYGTEDTIVYGPSAELPTRFQPLPNGRYQQLCLGDELDIGPFHVRCVGPESVSSNGEVNRDSLNFVVTYGQIRILFTGDYMDRAVRQLHGEDVANIDIYLFPHHGLEPFCVDALSLQLVNPSLILVPGNTAGRVREFCNQYGLKPLIRSPYYGNLVVLSDGISFELHENAEPGAYANAAE